MSVNNDKVKIFYSYSHNDEELRKKLDDHLAFLKHDSVIIWYDREILLGHELNEAIQKELNEANIILLLISSSFLSSFYCYEIEMKRAMEKHETKEAVVVPILLSDCVWQKAPFAKLLMAPYDAKPINNSKYWATIDEAFTKVAFELDKTVNWVKNNRLPEKVEGKATPNYSGNTLNSYPIPSKFFTGRKKEILEFQSIFDSFRIFAIEGLGGAGKTQFAAKIIEDLVQDKSRVIWLNGSTQSNFDVFVESAGYGDVLKGEKKTDLALFSGFKDLIEKDKRIIFWDNFNDYEDPAFYNFLSFSSQYLRKATIILITKTDPFIAGITSLPIVRLEGLNEDALEYAKKLKVSNSKYSTITDLELEKICIGVEGHPLAIEFAIWLMGYGKTADEILIHLPEFNGLKKVEEFSKRLFLDIFNHAKTNDKERDCLLKCSVFKERILLDGINYIYDGEDVFHLLAGLIDKLLITYKPGYYEIHPLIRSFCYEKLNEKFIIHKKAAEYYISQRLAFLNSSLEEKIYYHLYEAKEYDILANFIEKHGTKFIEQGQLGIIGEFMNKLLCVNISRPIFEIFYGDIAQIKAEWTDALMHYSIAMQNNTDKNLTAESTIKYGEILFRKGNAKESIQYFRKAYSYSKANMLKKEEARALNDIGLVNNLFGNYDSAYASFAEALKIRKAINDEDGIASTYNNIGVLFADRKKFDKAIEFLYESLRINKQIDNKSSISVNLSNISDVLKNQGKLDEALEKITSAKQMAKVIGDKDGICRCNNIIGVIYQHKNQIETALLFTEKCLKLSEEIDDKLGIASSYCNYGSIYFNQKKYELSLEFFFKSYDLHCQIGYEKGKNLAISWIKLLMETLGKDDAKELSKQVYNRLDSETKKSIVLEEFISEPIARRSPKIGRNDPCPCGSGKKFKQCHGLN